MIFYAPFNMGSLPKNLSLLEDFITTINEPPGIIAISAWNEVKRRNIYNIKIPGYSFINANSRAAVGDVHLHC